MSVVPQTSIPPSPAEAKPVPPLHNGDRLTREEFHRRYLRMPHVKKAELIEGIVYMSSPIRWREHARQNDDLIAWMSYYRAKTPGVLSGGNATIVLDEGNEPQPDAQLFIPHAAGGQATINADGYIVGAPELVAEVAGSTASIDLHYKLAVYQRHGVREYLVWRVDDRAIDYFILHDGKFVPLAPVDGIYKSECFPGLWLNIAAMLNGDLAAVFATVDRGVAETDHAAFAARVRPKS